MEHDVNQFDWEGTFAQFFDHTAHTDAEKARRQAERAEHFRQAYSQGPRPFTRPVRPMAYDNTVGKVVCRVNGSTPESVLRQFHLFPDPTDFPYRNHKFARPSAKLAPVQSFTDHLTTCEECSNGGLCSASANLFRNVTPLVITL